MQSRSAAARTSVVALLLALLVPATAATAEHVTVRETAGACADAPDDGFTDTGTEGEPQEEAVDCIAWYEITGGVTTTTYEPATRIRRAQMARMVAESMRRSLQRFAEPGQSVDHFADDDSSPFEDDIDFVAEYGVVRGTGGSSYDPAGFVSRGQMATFLVNQLEAIGANVPDADGDYFDDDNSSVHETNINKLAALGIASGRTHRGFEPAGPVTRGQMALFISRDLSYLVDQGLMVPPDEAVATAEDGAHTNAVVASVVRAGDTFTSSADDEEHGAERFWYDDNDVFLDPDGGDITMAEFEGLLTGPVGETEADVVDVTYAHAPGEESTFQVVTDNVPPPTGVTAVAGDHDGDGDGDDVIVSWTASAQPNVIYDVFRDDDSEGTILVPADPEVASDQTGTSVLLTDQPDDTYSYYVRAESPPTGATSSDAASNEVTLPAAGDTSGQPVARAVVQSGADGEPGEADTGDTWRLAFDQPLGAIEEGDSLTLIEGSDTAQGSAESRETVEHAPPLFPGFPSSEGDATFSLNSESMTVNGTPYGAGQVLTVELHADLVDGDGQPVTYPMTVLYSTGLTDEDGQPIDWPSSVDRVVEADTTIPFIVDATGDLNGTGPDQITLTYSEDVVCDTDEDPETQFRYDRDSSVSGDEETATGITCAGDNTIVLEFGDGVFVPDSPRDLVLYDESATAAARVEDNVGNDARSSDSEGVDG